jgi:CDP-4-dehydro-6-deoxyglucose reductase
MAVSRRKAHIARLDRLSSSVRGIALACSDGPLSFEAGQWINVEATMEAGFQKRAYSIASAPNAALVELAVTLVPEGALSPFLHQAPLGTELIIDGPHGFFTRNAALVQQPTLMVATGTGLAPFRSMLLGALSEPAEIPPPTLLFGCRSEADILWRDELEALASEGRIRLEVTLSRPGAGWRGRTGYVQHHVPELARALVDAAGPAREPNDPPHVYVCGLNRMVSEVRQVCKQQLGYPRTSIHSERYD